MSEPDRNDDAKKAPEQTSEVHEAVDVEVLSGRPVGRRFRDVVVVVGREDLNRLLDSRSDEAESPPPTTPDEFRSILAEVDRLGWQWTTDNPPALASKAPDNEDPAVLKDLSKKYPTFPYELAAVVKYALWGFPPDTEVVGSDTDLAAKVSVATDMLLTDDYRSEFFFEHATRIKRFHDLDWEVMIKAAERNVRRVPGTVYATVSLETSETQPDFDERKESVHFAVDARALKRMIGLLNDALKALEDAKVMAHNMRHEKGGRDVG